ncbi:hypothetical protein OIO90_006581, partial [Microbotryomycetes sp. JL221]
MTESLQTALRDLLPFELDRLVSFCLQDETVQRLVNSASNDFFTVASAQNAASSVTTAYVKVRDDEKASWSSLPQQWTSFFDSFVVHEGHGRSDQHQRQQDLLRDLANGHIRHDYPESLAKFIETCKHLSFDRTCDVNLEPILTYPPSQLPTPSASHCKNTDGFDQARAKPKKKSNAFKAGQSPKKQHEVENFSRLAFDVVSNVEQRHKPTHVIDVGSGRAHLSRALTEQPLNLHVLAVDWSPSQTRGADYLTGIKQRGLELVKSESLGPNLVQGSLTTKTSTLDSEAIVELMGAWPPFTSVEAVGETRLEDSGVIPPAMLVALHACGDLTLDAIKAFVRDHRQHGKRQRRQAILCGCCYNLMTPSTFPLSALLKTSVQSLSSKIVTMPAMTRAHLRLTANSPQTWHISPDHSSQLKTSILKLCLRARFESELKHVDLATDGSETNRVGKISINVASSNQNGQAREMMGYRQYKKKALQ